MSLDTKNGKVSTNIKKSSDDDTIFFNELIETYKIDEGWRVLLNMIKLGLLGMATYEYTSPEWLAFNDFYCNGVSKLMDLGYPAHEIKDKIENHLLK